MDWNLEAFWRQCSRMDFILGKSYFEDGCVTNIQTTQKGSARLATCMVKDAGIHHVTLVQNEKALAAHCDCDDYIEEGCCKHAVAALLACIDQDVHGTGNTEKNPAPARVEKNAPSSDDNAKYLLRRYMDQTALLPAVPARLVPRFWFKSKISYPTLTFQVGIDRLYVVRNIPDFLAAVSMRQTQTYGKGLTLFHGMEQFDDRSQALIRLLMDQYQTYRSMNSSNNYYSSIYYEYGNKNEITINGGSFDQLFDLLKGTSVQQQSNNGTFELAEEDPQVHFKLTRKDGAADVKIRMAQACNFFGSSDALYARTENRILRCSSEFREKVYPMLSSGSKQMQFALGDLPALCSYVLPAVGPYVTVKDPDALLQEYGPDECTPCFYFDIEDDVLTLRLVFRYAGGDVYYTGQNKEKPGVKRDPRAEQETAAMVKSVFEEQPDGFTLSGADTVFDFLTEQLPRWHERGEVYISDRLRGRHIQPTGSSVGVSLSDGTLALEINTGGFPPEELEALYQSLLQKRRYHRLSDGRYLSLDGSPCEKLAEMTHMLQLSPEQLASGKVELPAFRGLYLDNLLKGDNGLQVSRDKQFRTMVRNFKSVAESDYTVPDSLDKILRPYQKVGFRWLKTLESCHFGGILADEMGLGKTLQVIAFLLTVRRSETGLPSLIVCPASLVLNWADELARFAPELKPLLVMGTAAERKRLLAAGDGADVWVTSYELLRQDTEQYQNQKFYSCVLDEGQHIKNRTTLASKAVKQVDARQRFVLTGTPIENRLSELWNLFDFLMPGYLFSHGSFVEKLEKPVVKSGDEGASAQLRRLVQPFLLRRLKSDVLRELPPKIEHVRRIPLTEEERRAYHASAAAALQSLAGGGQGKLAILAALTRLRQICCAPDLCFENYDGPRSKLEACLELCSGLAENGHQILLFSQFTSMLDLIRPRLDALGISSFTLQGSTPKQERARLVKAFNEGGASVFLISLKAGGTGLNLTAADTVIHYDPWWNLAAQEQATDRAHRIGQLAHVQVYKLIAQDSIEERILDLQSKKAALMDAVSGDGSAAILEMSKDDLLALLE